MTNYHFVMTHMHFTRNTKLFIAFELAHVVQRFLPSKLGSTLLYIYVDVRRV